MRTAQKSIAPSTGPNTVAAPPSSSIVQTKNVIDRAMPSGWTARGST